MLLNILDEFVADESNAFKDEGEDAIFESIVKDMSPQTDIKPKRLASFCENLCIWSMVGGYYFFCFFWLAPLGGVIGRPELSPP